MSEQQFTVRAIDVGYGHIKYTDGRDPENQALRTASFPSKSPPAADGQEIDANVIERRDTFVVAVNGRNYEVGNEVGLGLHGRREGDVLDYEFSLSDAYAARLYGALNYISPSLPANVIDYLVLGLPLTTYRKRHAALARRFMGEHNINLRGDTIVIEHCEVYPQPLGAYACYLATSSATSGKRIPTALVIDPGYNTVDWFVCTGMKAIETMSSAVELGVLAVLRAVAERIVNASDADSRVTEIVRGIDRAYMQGTEFIWYGKPVCLDEFMASGERVIEEAAQAIKNSVGSGGDIDVVLMTGGGARLYAQAVAKKFPQHDFVTLNNPAHANVRGFQIMGEKLARSAARALGRATKEKAK